MSKKRERPRYRSPRRRRVTAGPDDRLSTILFNPVYGYGRWLEPRDVVAAHVLSKNVELAARQRAQGCTLTLDELDAEFVALMDDLVTGGLCRRLQDLPPLIPKAKWLQAQQETIRRL
ncbi:MAG TPA: hypothetical protein VLC95_16680, partial [Anaerolineae bacterium]|nr:hypothetical protein [Anaerolineae bacterium]